MYQLAQERYAEMGVDTEAALKRLAEISISLHCWQGDDVQGFEKTFTELGGGLAVTGNYPGRARNPDQLRDDLRKAFSLIPGRHRLNLHASYGEFEGRSVDRDQIEPRHFQAWIDWAKEQHLGLDFNPTFFSHDKAGGGFTLAHSDRATRDFWIEHGIRCRQIGAEMGRQLGTACVTNVWIPDGHKDTPVDRRLPRQRLADSLDAIFAQPLDARFVRDAVECKLFGIGSESYVVGSHEFYMGYALSRKKLLCLDAGHFHPTEVISDKISSVLTFLEEILLHVSRGVRWDSDHVVTFTDELQAIAQEVIRGDFLSRVHLGLDFFDASINRVAAWVIGTRNLQKALLYALLEPIEQLRRLENASDYTSRLAILEEQRTLPFGAVWDQFCRRHEVPVGRAWLDDIQRYERAVLSTREG
jgi:L-rhamnose isomerase